MEHRRKSSSSGELFSFPSTPNQDQGSDFEFGFFTRPSSPSLDPYRISPADHLFFNGRLLPHSFPLKPSTKTKMASTDHGSRGTSRTSSINSKNSLMSSRSNSTNSRSSTSSSARTSSSDGSERRLLYRHSRIQGCNYNNRASKLVTHRCQFITAVPVMKQRVTISRRKNGEAKNQSDDHQEKCVSKGRSKGCLRFFRLFLLACKECHAMEPSRKQRCGARKLNHN